MGPLSHFGAPAGPPPLSGSQPGLGIRSVAERDCGVSGARALGANPAKVHPTTEGASMRRVLLVLAALALPSSIATVAFSAPAGASGVTTKCTTITGPVTGNITISGCKGGSTGGSSQPFAAASLATGGTITWSNGNTTTVGTAKVTSSKKLTKKCVAKYGTGASEFTAKGTVTAQSGTGDSPIPGKFSGEVCEDSSGNLHALKPLTAN